MGMSDIIQKMKRQKPFGGDILNTQLNRCLTTFDLTLFGVGSMTGSGIYVLTGTVVKDKAGPLAFLSFCIAGITAFFNALCYAELGSRIPKAGSAYTYTYIAAGEFPAFIIGWAVILEYILSVASVARGFSGVIDSMAHKAMTQAVEKYLPTFYFENRLQRPDLLAVGIIFVNTILVATGPKISASINNFITTVNITVIFAAMVTMFSFPYSESGQKKHNVTMEGIFPTKNHDLLPYGIGGIIAGAGTCFYSFIGFDAICVTSEEAISPKKSIPISTGVSVGFITILFVLTALSLTLFVPWHLIDPASAFPEAFLFRQMKWFVYIIGVGSLLGITSSLFTNVYAMPRISYAMAEDGLLPSLFSKLSKSTQVPTFSLLVTVILASILAFIFDIETLADFLSIGTLLAYIIVCMNVMVLRYRKPDDLIAQQLQSVLPTEPGEEDCRQKAIDSSEWTQEVGRPMSPFNNISILSSAPQGCVPITSMIILTVLSFILGVIVFKIEVNSNKILLTISIILSILIISLMILIGVHQQNKRFDTFKVPFVPLLPCLTIILNIMLIVKLSIFTWIRFAIWIIIGLFIYFFYGIDHSLLNGPNSGVSKLTYNTFKDSHMGAASEKKALASEMESQPEFDDNNQ